MRVRVDVRQRQAVDVGEQLFAHLVDREERELVGRKRQCPLEDAADDDCAADQRDILADRCEVDAAGADDIVDRLAYADGCSQRSRDRQNRRDQRQRDIALVW